MAGYNPNSFSKRMSIEDRVCLKLESRNLQILKTSSISENPIKICKPKMVHEQTKIQISRQIKRKIKE